MIDAWCESYERESFRMANTPLVGSCMDAPTLR